MICTRASAPSYGSGRRNAALMTVNIAVFAPMPIANTRTMVIAKAGRFRRPRSARPMFFRNMPTIGLRKKGPKGSAQLTSELRVYRTRCALTVCQRHVDIGQGDALHREGLN